MRSTLLWFFTLRGRLTRVQFLGWGVGLLVLKLVLDAWLSRVLGLDPWTPLVYLTPLPWSALRHDDGWRWMLFALPSVMFCWIGVAMTWRRLGDAGLPSFVLPAFFVPYANLVLFVLLGALPAHDAPRAGRPARSAVPLRLPGPTPAAVAAFVTIALAWLSFGFVRDYGGILFFGLPTLQGVLVGMLTAQRPFADSLGQLLLSFLLGAFVLLVSAFEGLLCLAMVAPAWIGMGVLGLLLGRTIHPAQRRAAMLGLTIVPLLQWLEPHLAPDATVYEVQTDVVVKATPERVWRSLVAFEQLPPPTELPFRLGVAYPMHATIDGEGPGAVRRCSFSTGDFVEPIEVWDEPRLLRFAVRECPSPMQEWNPFHDPADVHAAHLHGYFQARRGQFELAPLADGTTRLCGTTWYSHGLRPEPYWRWWSDWLVHTIHGRVLDHIRRAAER